MTSQVIGKNCDGGHTCFPPKECCKQGCCYLLASPVYKPPSLPSGNMSNPLFLGHWYFWLAVTATIAGILCACSLWRRHSHHSGFCCRDSMRDERASEPDSNGSCYAPPQYSRCNSFLQAPPPYSEVTSKPDLYPLVISYNRENTVKSHGPSTGYLMVQYFRNFIVRPVGTLSATSTIDSLSSSFICNAANEVNTVIPPPYSCTGSLEEVDVRNTTSADAGTQFPRSSTCGSDLQRVQNSPSVHSFLSNSISSQHNPSPPQVDKFNIPGQSSNSALLITSNPCFDQNVDNANMMPNETCKKVDNQNLNNTTKDLNKTKYRCDPNSLQKVNSKKITSNFLAKETSLDSESQEDEHNFADLLNLSVCVPSTANQLPLGSSGIPHLQQSYSVANSMTSSDISSLANLGTPDSPPRATSPTAEMRELLGKIQQLPQQRSPIEQANTHQQPISKANFHKIKSKTLYMPLHEPHTSKHKTNSKNTTSGYTKIGARTWLSRSAPSTPCDIFLPNFSSSKRNSGSQKTCKLKLTDGSPLLNATEESDEDAHKNYCS